MEFTDTTFIWELKWKGLLDLIGLLQPVRTKSWGPRARVVETPAT